MRRSVGKHRRTRRAPRMLVGPWRFLAASFAGALLIFSLAATAAAAAPRGTPARVGTDGGGEGYDTGRRSPEAQAFERDLKAFIEAFLARLRHDTTSAEGGAPSVHSTPPTTVPTRSSSPPPTTPATQPPVPSTTPTAGGGSPTPAAGIPAAATATVVSGASAAVSTNGAATGGSPPGHVPSDAGVPVSGPAPQIAFPFPAPSSHGAVIRALRTAGPYGLLFALVGAVLVFLAVQGRVDRRDPRIARAPVDAHLDFRDLE